MLVMKKLAVVELSADNNAPLPSNLDEKKAGQVITYTVKEIDVPEGYNTAVEANESGQVVVTNTHAQKRPKKRSKKWEDADNQDGLRPASICSLQVKTCLYWTKALELSAAND